MATTATAKGVVLDRKRVSFDSRQSDGTTETVTYFEAILYDSDTRDLTVFRSTTEADLDAFVPGTQQTVEGRPGDKPATIRAALVKPAREGSDGRY